MKCDAGHILLNSISNTKIYELHGPSHKEEVGRLQVRVHNTCNAYENLIISLQRDLNELCSYSVTHEKVVVAFCQL